MSEYVSELAKALSARERRAFEFDTAGFLGLGGAPLAKIKIRVATKAEQDRAVLAAYKYIADLAANVGLDAAAAADRDLLVDAKTCHILFAVCRDANNPAYPAFPGPKWMMDHLSADELAVLLSCYAEALRMTGTIEMDLSAERLDGLVTALAASADSDAPNLHLLRFTREQLTELCVRLALRLNETSATKEQEPCSSPSI